MFLIFLPLPLIILFFILGAFENEEEDGEE